MREPPVGVGDAEVLAAVRRDWDDAVDRVEHLPVGFGAHHWAAYDGEAPRLFVTFDRLEPKRTAARLEAAYAGAAALREAGLEFVLAGRATHAGRFTVPLADGALSCTPWRDGRPGGPLDLAWTTDALRPAPRGRAAGGPPALAAAGRPRLRRDHGGPDATRTGVPAPTPTAARDAVRAPPGRPRPMDGALPPPRRGRPRPRPGSPPTASPTAATSCSPPRAGSWSTGSRSSWPRASSTSAPWSTPAPRPTPTRRCSSCSTSSGGSTRSASTPRGSPRPTPAPPTTRSRSAGCSHELERT